MDPTSKRTHPTRLPLLRMRREASLLVAAGPKGAGGKLFCLRPHGAVVLGGVGRSYVPCFFARARSNMPLRAGASGMPAVRKDHHARMARYGQK